MESRLAIYDTNSPVETGTSPECSYHNSNFYPCQTLFILPIQDKLSFPLVIVLQNAFLDE